MCGAAVFSAHFSLQYITMVGLALAIARHEAVYVLVIVKKETAHSGPR